MRRDVRCGDERAAGLLGEQMSWCIGSRTHARTIPARRTQGGYIFYAGGSLAGAGYCRECCRRLVILLLQLWQGCQVCVKISAQRLPRVAQY